MMTMMVCECFGWFQVVSISRSFDIAQTDVQLMLQYFHRRGRLVYFADDPVLSRLVVVNPTWFVQTLSRAVDGFERSLVDSAHLLQSLADKELDRQLQVSDIVSTGRLGGVVVRTSDL